ncbi:MAG: 4Fe-4S dicluster domain-containing protein [Deltaproteobacteria bacterium]|jgi:formate hydrogenlyase subunit 6/NADH:ubiquinone oxidoreductase subunit I|nr:4Fe-4S dicluster domain-containing protein [Deltaproteobacteria bacterium]MBW2182579.1 4Fe-4S dicluster domain-containing protein [Deltaproteobacteria bacterium]MCK5256715.1 4Fe-4S dicluster domain-containing protein [Deltaproteobacteria bacterium]
MFKIDQETCTGCSGCQEICPEIAIASVNGLMEMKRESVPAAKSV